MKKYYPFFLIATLFACELVIDVDVPFKQAELTLNTFFNPNGFWETYITLNKGILNDSPHFQMVTNAQVIIYEGDSPIDTLDDKHLGYYQSNSKKPLIGKNYEIRASAPNYEPVNAQSSIPYPAPITNVHISEKEPVGGEGTPITLKFTDPANDRNFYHIVFQKEHEYVELHSGEMKTERYYLDTESNDPGLDEDTSLDDGYLIKDVLFNGKEAEFSFKSHDANILNYAAIIVTVYTVSEEYYNYKITSQLQKNTSGDPFAQPVNVYCNIKNGFGIFAGYSQSTFIRRSSKPAPVITGFSVNSGRPGDHVIIYGENFGENSNIYSQRIAFKGDNFLRYGRPVSASSNQIEVIVPEGAITGKIYFLSTRVAISDEEFEVID